MSDDLFLDFPSEGPASTQEAAVISIRAATRAYLRVLVCRLRYLACVGRQRGLEHLRTMTGGVGLTLRQFMAVALPFFCGSFVGGLAYGYFDADFIPLLPSPPARVVLYFMAAPMTPEQSPSPSRPAAATPVLAATPAPAYLGALAVDSHPDGARVYLNGRIEGTTPLALSDLPIGSRALRLELDGYDPWSQAVQVNSGQLMVVTANLLANTQ